MKFLKQHPRKKPAPVPAVSPTQPPKSQPQTELLIQEYGNLVKLYTHTENSLFSIFNFYITLLTALIGATIVLWQVLAPKQADIRGIALVLLVFVILLGLITQDALIRKNSDLAHFALAINAVKVALTKDCPDLQEYMFFLENIHARVNPLKHPPTLDERVDRYLWWMLPLGIQQLFVSVVSSLALAAIVLLMIISLAHDVIPLWQLLLGGAIVLGLGYITNCVYTNLKFRQDIRRGSVRMDGKPYQWQ